MIVGQGPIALAVGAGGGCLDIFTLSMFLFSFSLSLGDGPIYTEILSQKSAKPKTTNKQTTNLFFFIGKPGFLLVCFYRKVRFSPTGNPGFPGKTLNLPKVYLAFS